MDLDLRQLLHIARRRWWIVALLMIVAGASAYISSSRETPMYSATASMVINPGLSTSTNDYNAVLTSQRLATTYQEMVTTNSMQDRVERAIDEPLVTGFSASASEDSQIIRVTASGPDSEQAALVANTVVEQFQAYMQDRTEERASSNRSSLDDQIAALEQRQQEIDAQIADLSEGDNSDDSAVRSQIEDLSSERSSISQTLLDLNTQAITIDTQMSASSVQIEMLDPAVEPGSPYSPQPMRSLLLGLFVGALLGAGLVALLEFLDNTVKPEVNVHGLTGAPVLATVSQLQNITPGGRQV